MADKPKAELFDDRRKFLAAAIADKRDRFKVIVRQLSGDVCGMMFGVGTGPQVRDAAEEQFITITKLTRADMEELMRQELTAKEEA